jgi:3-oxoacyl-[acyl-carrier-protein] synthase III
MPVFAHVTGWGMAVPEKVLTNEDIAQFVDTTDEWIKSRTGIEQRRIAHNEQTTASLATDAAKKALQMANLPPSRLDLIIVSTSSPEHIFPATACLVQDRIGADHAGAFDLLAACTGFIYALNMAAQAIRSGSIQNALIIGSETLSRIIDWEDRNTCILFGDGAGAFVLQASDTPGGVLSAVMRSDGSGADLLTLPGGGSRHPTTTDTVQQGLHFIQMNGREVFRFATRVMAQATEEVVTASNLILADIDLIIPHQANYRIIEAAARGLKLPLDKFIINLERYGNTSTASIPIAACEAIQQGRLKAGEHVVFVGFGAGLTWGSIAVQWSGPFETKPEVRVWNYSNWARLRSLLRRLRRRLEGIIWGRKNGA